MYQDCLTVDLSELDFVCNPDTPNIPKVNETCIPESCEGDYDCEAGLVCVYGACATASGEVQAGCPCSVSSQCANRDCITVNAIALDFVCNPDLSPVPTAAPVASPNSTDGSESGASVHSVVFALVVAVVSIMQIYLSY
jgi:hypothetical protein